MKRLFLILALLLPTAHAVPVGPIVQPHVTFVNASGGACAGCSLYTYAAGTTTPQATYTDSTGTSVNTNPIILDAAGGAQIWLSITSYKLVLVDPSTATIWSVDNVPGGGGVFPCGTPYAIQIANSAVNGLTCDTSITINTTTHAINVGTLPSAHVSIGALGTPTSWVFDTTTPATALASLGGGTVTAGTLDQLAFYDAAGTTISGTSSIPPGITAITQSPGDNSTNPATTAYVALPGPINPTTLKVGSGVAMTGNQGNGLLIQHSTGATVTGDFLSYNTNGDAIDSGVAILAVQSGNLGGSSRAFGTAYQNTGTSALEVVIECNGAGASGGAKLNFMDGAVSGVWTGTWQSSNNNNGISISKIVPQNWFYEATCTSNGGTPALDLTQWVETTL